MKPEVLTSVTAMLGIVTIIALSARGAVSLELAVTAILAVAGLGGYKALAEYRYGKK